MKAGKRSYIWMWIVTSVYAFVLGTLNFVRIFDNNFWGDEGFSIIFSKLSITEMIHQTAMDVHPPLYYLFAALGYHITGEQGWMYHFVSFLAYAFILIVALTIIWREFGAFASIFLISFSSLLTVSLKYNVEARMYSWANLFVLMSFFEFYMILKNEKMRDYCLFVFFSLCAAYSHYYALLTVAFFYIFALILMFFKRLNSKKVVGACAVTILLYLPWLSIFMNTYDRVSKAFWISGVPSFWACLKYMFATGKVWSGESWTTELYLFVFAFAVAAALVEETRSKEATHKKANITTYSLWIIAGY